MAKKKLLFVADKIPPYLPADDATLLKGQLPQKMSQNGFEVRTFMPKFGLVNERRNQLHEVIRLSGMNIPINDNDHPLIIKVASLQPARIQVYFIDNDDYFLKNDDDADAQGSNRADNDERMLFFARGASETVRKLRWDTDIAHISGWMSALLPLYMREVFASEPAYCKGKIVYSVMPGEITGGIDEKIFEKLAADGVPAVALEQFAGMPFDTEFIHKIAIRYADAVIFHGENPNGRLVEYAQSLGIPVCGSADLEGDGTGTEVAEFYKSLIPEE